MPEKTSGRFGIVVLAAAAGLAAACGGASTQAPKPKAETRAVEYFHPDPATAAAVHGRVFFHGKKPPKKAIPMDADAACINANQGRTIYEEPIVTGRQDGLANAFLYIKTGLEGRNFEPPKEPVKIAQHGCMFAPRAIGVQAGQTVDVANLDPVSHNFHAMPSNNRDWDQQQSPGAAEIEHRFPRPEIMIPVKCNVHAWMRAYIGVMPHPYYAVTGPDGAWQFTNVPPGDYTVGIWHEKLGEKTVPLHLDPSGKTALDFTFE